MNVELHIERLILDGLQVGPGQEKQVGAEVEAELARLLAAGELGSELTDGGARAGITAGTIHPSPDRGPDHLGRQIAQAVYGSLGGRTANADADRKHHR